MPPTSRRRWRLHIPLSKYFAVLSVSMLLAACGHLVPLVPDGQWHTVYSIQAPNRSVATTVVSTTAPRPDCDRSRIPEPTHVRVVLLESFQVLSALPERLEDAPPREDNIPIKLADTGPQDLTLDGATRVLPLTTTKELLVRTRDRCTALRLFHLRNPE